MRLYPTSILSLFLYYLLWFNTMLAVFNLIPLPPLDGSKVIAGLLPPRYLSAYYRIEPYGPLILILLLATDILSNILRPIVGAVLHAIQLAAGWGIF